MRILIVDDDQDALNDIAEALKPTGYQIVSFQNPLKALENYKKKSYDVVISDVRMPEMTGIELLIELRKFDPEARVIIMTAFGDLETAIAAVNNKAYSFFGKPINFHELILVLHRISDELKNGKMTHVDFKKLQSEYSDLKVAYDSLYQVLQTLQKGENK